MSYKILTLYKTILPFTLSYHVSCWLLMQANRFDTNLYAFRTKQLPLGFERGLLAKWLHACESPATGYVILDQLWLSYSAVQEILCFLWRLGVRYRTQKSPSFPRPCVTFHNSRLFKERSCFPCVQTPTRRTTSCRQFSMLTTTLLSKGRPHGNVVLLRVARAPQVGLCCYKAP